MSLVRCHGDGMALNVSWCKACHVVLMCLVVCLGDGVQMFDIDMSRNSIQMWRIVLLYDKGLLFKIDSCELAPERWTRLQSLPLTSLKWAHFSGGTRSCLGHLIIIDDNATCMTASSPTAPSH